jgi:hypothetical protein
MKLIRELKELKKGDTVIVKDNEFFTALGFSTLSGDVFSFEKETPYFTIRCLETSSIEKVSIEEGRIFLIN